MIKQLKDKTLLKTGSLVNGQWHASEQQFSVHNPYDNALLSNVSDAIEKDDLSLVESAVQSAKHAQENWAATTAYEKSSILMRWYELMIEHKEDLALIMTLEQGKPLTESRGEIEYGASYVKWFAEEVKRIYGETIPALNSNQEIKVIKQPIGVVAAITPWNFPNSMLVRKIAPALAAGNTVVCRPSELTPLSALAVGELAQRAGFPSGILNIIVSQSSAIVGKVFTEHPDIGKFSFTGSTRVGKLLMEQSSASLKKLSLELGGNAPFIVFDDADIDAAVAGAIKAKFRNAGQTCVCANRILVHDAIYAEFLAKFIEQTKTLSVGNGLDDVDIGPLIHLEAAHKVRELVNQAIDEGAKVEFGEANNTNLQSPIVLSGITNDMKIAQNEIFGPVAAIQKFRIEQEAVTNANDTPFGLAAYFYSLDVRRINRVANALKYGMVGVNEGIISNAAAPFGGIKQSGFGREGARQGLEEYLNTKYICSTF